MTHLRSPYSTPETVKRLETLLPSRGLSILGRIDHAAAASEVGLQMQAAVVLIFGNPKAGTPLMIAAPTLAIDLPLKALVWEDSEGNTWLSFNTPEYLQERHDIPAELMKNIAGTPKLLEEALRAIPSTL